MIGKAIEHFSVAADVESICRMFDWVHNSAGMEPETEKDKMHGCILGLTLMAAFARLQNSRTYLYPYYVSGNEESEQNWNRILEYISCMIEKNKEEHTSDNNHWSHSNLYTIRVFDTMSGLSEGMYEGIDERKRKVYLNIVELIINIDQYVVVASHYKGRGSWQEYLFRAPSMCGILKKTGPIRRSGQNEKSEENDKCQPYQNLLTLKEAVFELKTESDREKKETLKSMINAWITEVARNAQDRHDIRNWVSLNPSEAQANHRILRWLLENMPSLALFMRNTEAETAPNMQNLEYRFNVMDNKFTDSIYLDRYTRYSVYKRMSEKWKIQPKRQRFSMSATTSFCQLAVHRIPTGVHFVSRGKVSREMRRSIIVPLTGSSLTALIKRINKGEMHELVSVFERIANLAAAEFKDRKDDLNGYDNNSSQNLAFILSNFTDKMNKLLKNTAEKKKEQESNSVDAENAGTTATENRNVETSDKKCGNKETENKTSANLDRKVWEKITDTELEKYSVKIMDMMDISPVQSSSATCTSQNAWNTHQIQTKDEEWIRSERCRDGRLLTDRQQI